MGAVVSRWKTRPSTVELLESIDQDIQHLDELRVKNQRLLKLCVGRLLLYSFLLYLVTCVTVCLWYLPDQWTGRLMLALPFLAFPALVWFLRKLLICLFSKRTEKNNEKLEDLMSQKRKINGAIADSPYSGSTRPQEDPETWAAIIPLLIILEQVMETETYKNAKLILERFDPESKRKIDLEPTSAENQMTPRLGQVRLRNVTQKAPVLGTPMKATRPPLVPGATPSGPILHSAPGGPPEKSLSAAATPQSLMRRPVTPGSPGGGIGTHPPGPPLARPISPRSRGAIDRVIEYLVRDGPQNRYALMCQQCLSHNGMALKEDFEYIAFRCAYCYFLNPARKTRSPAPRLGEVGFQRRESAKQPASASEAKVENKESSPEGSVLPSQEALVAGEPTAPEYEKTPSEKPEEE